MIGEQRYTVWPEGQPENAVATNNWLRMQWLVFWIGLKTSWPNPLNAKRVCCLIEGTSHDQ